MANRAGKRKSSMGLKVLCASLLLVLVGLLTWVWVLKEEEAARLANIRPDVAVEAGSTSVDPADFLKEQDGNPVTFVSGVTQEQLAVPGTYPVIICWNERQYASTVRVADTVKPTGKPVNLTVLERLPEPQEMVTEIKDVTAVTVTYQQIPDITVAGEKDVTLLLTDTSGNVRQVHAVLTVLIDEQAPVITGVKPITIYLGDTVSYRSGIAVSDDYDAAPVLTVDSSAVDLSKVGKYDVIYCAVDASGNEAQIKTTIDVRAKKAGFVELEVIYAEVDKLLDQIVKDGMTKKEQVKAIYRWARNNCWYANHSDKSDYLQGAYVMMTQRAGDCFNYFAVTKLMFERLGIDNIDVRKVKNYSGDSDHYWSLVSLDGGQTWYHFDATPRVGSGDDFCLVTDKFLDAYSAKHGNCHNRDKSLYPATPEK